MLNVHNIAKLYQHQAWPRIIDRILANGRLPGTSPDIFKHPAVIQQAALALALLRSSELSYANSPVTPTLISHLLANQREDGLFARPDICNQVTLFSTLERTTPPLSRASFPQTERANTTDLSAQSAESVRTNPSIEDHDLLLSALATTAVAVTALATTLDNLQHPEASGINSAQVQKSLEAGLAAISNNFAHLSATERNFVLSLCSAPGLRLAVVPGSSKLSEVVSTSAPLSRPPAARRPRNRKPAKFSAAA